MGPPDDPRDWLCSHKPCEGARTRFDGEPIAEIENDSREKPGLGQSETKAQDVEASWGSDKDQRGRNDPPGHHEDDNPSSRAETFKDQVAGYLEDKVAQEKHACSASVHHIIEAKLLLHLQGSEPDIHPVQIGNDVEQK